MRNKVKIIGLMTAIIGLISAIIGAFVYQKISIEDSNFVNSPVINESENIHINYQNNTNIPWDKKFEINLENFNGIEGYKIRAISNLKIIFPNNKMAFVSKVPESGILAYANADCSEIRVTEKYQQFIPEEEICWIKYIDCASGFMPELHKGPKANIDEDPCWELEQIR